MTQDFSLPMLSRWHKKNYLHYAMQLLESQQKMMANPGNNILHYVLEHNTRYEKMSHYPREDRIDRSTGAQYFYHCHREDHTTTEHGHFHCFLRYKYIPKRIKPAKLTDWDRYIDNPMTHLVAIGMNQCGAPIRLFTVNRWVSGDIWYDAAHAAYFVKRFKMTLTDSAYWNILDQWVEGMLHLFAPQIQWLHQERDRVIQEHQRQYPDENSYLNEKVDELSSLSIDLKQQIEWIFSQ